MNPMDQKYKILSLRTFALFIFAVIIFFPLLNVFFTSFKTMREYVLDPLGFPWNATFDNYINLFAKYHFERFFINSFSYTFFTVILVIFFSSMVAYACMRIGGWKGTFIFGIFVLGMLVPAQVNIVPLYGMVRRFEEFLASIGWNFKILDTIYGLVAIRTATTLSISVFILTGFMKTLPRELFEAAAVDGASEWYMYSRIALPLSLPSVASSSIFLCVIVWNDLLYPLIFTSKTAATLTMGLMMFRGEYESNYPALFAAIIVASIPMLLAYLFFQRWFVAGITAGSLKG